MKKFVDVTGKDGDSRVENELGLEWGDRSLVRMGEVRIWKIVYMALRKYWLMRVSRNG